MKIVIVPLKTIAENKQLRLDPGYYLGTNEEAKEAKARNTLVNAIKRYPKVVVALAKSRIRMLSWRIRGKAKYL